MIPMENITVDHYRANRNADPIAGRQYIMNQEIDLVFPGHYNTADTKGCVGERLMVVTANNDPRIGNMIDYTGGYNYSSNNGGYGAPALLTSAQAGHGVTSPTGFYYNVTSFGSMLYSRKQVFRNFPDNYTGDFTIELLGGGAISVAGTGPNRIISSFATSGDSFVRFENVGTNTYVRLFIGGYITATLWGPNMFSSRLWSIYVVRKSGVLSLFINGSRAGDVYHNSTHAMNFASMLLGHGSESASFNFYSLKVIKSAIVDPNLSTVPVRAFAWWQ